MRMLMKSSPIDLTIVVVVILKAFLPRLKIKDMRAARIVNASPLTYRKYVDDSHARF